MNRRPYCCYCKRDLAVSTSHSALRFTLDHVKPLSLGGRKTVPCCFQCNNLKGNLTPESWLAFTKANPAYWVHFHTHEEVRRALFFLTAAAEGRRRAIGDSA